MTLWDAALIAASGLIAGALNAVAGGGTLVAFPALLATGMTARMANIVSTIGLVPGYAGGSVAYRRELAGQGSRVRALAVTSVLGGITGAVVLLATPESSFRVVVPYLILASCALLAVQPRVGRWVAQRQGEHEGERSEITWLVQAGVFLAAVYGSYFGAGLGVLLLSVLGILLVDGMQRLNALKGLLSFVINAVSVIVFVVAGHVDWPPTIVLALTAWIGGGLGVRFARRLSPTVLRFAVITLGVVVALVLLVSS